MQTGDRAAPAPGASDYERTMSMQMKWGSPATATPTSAVLGKRRADDSKLNDDDRFAKRLHRLSLDQTSDIRVNGTSNHYLHVSGVAPQTSVPHTSPPPEQQEEELMQVDDTTNRVYIHSLDQELADIEAAEEPQKLIFLPDIERHFSKIPQHLLRDRPTDHEGEGQEMVLYGAPKSLTVDESNDSVRKAIIEARQRARDKAVQDARSEDMSRRYSEPVGADPAETAHGYSSGYGDAVEDADPDAMDIE